VKDRGIVDTWTNSFASDMALRTVGVTVDPGRKFPTWKSESGLENGKGSLSAAGRSALSYGSFDFGFQFSIRFSVLVLDGHGEGHRF
jgi:hypothetical protein